MIHATPPKPPPPGPVLCVDVLCKPSRPDPRLDRVPPDRPSRAVATAADHAWIVRHSYWGGGEHRFAWGRR